MTISSQFPKQGIARLQNIELDHFWFKGRRKIINRLLAKYFPAPEILLLDLGCGTGFNVNELTDSGFNIIGADMHHEGLEQTLQVNPALRFVQADALQLPFKHDIFKGILSLDILEHTDDNLLLAQAYNALAPDGVLILSVPAIPWLWSYRDEAAGHLRRYTMKTLRAVLEKNGFHVQEIYRYQFLAMPLLILTRLAGKNKPTMRDMEDTPHPIVNRIMTWVNILEVELGRFIKWPWGSTIIAVCRKVD